jgi:hypothetical protein
VQEPIDAFFGVASLPAPDSRPANAGATSNREHRQPVGGVQYDLGALNMLQRPAPIADNRGQSRAIFGSNNQADILGHARRLAQHGRPVNPMNESVH